MADPRLPEGFRCKALDAGLAGGGRPDLCLVVGDEAFPAVGMFTKNRILAAPVVLCREHLRASRAILTTDTVPKLRQALLPGGGSLLGMAKGSGMIRPDMATMLAFLFTDHEPGMDPGVLLRAAVDRSFHRLSVDGDTSTNDSVILWTSGRRRGGEGTAFVEALDRVTLELARDIDGEGATKLVEVRVLGADSPEAAKLCARSIAQSPLVRTAVHGEDPNRGRILAAAGRSGAELDTRRVEVGIGPARLFAEDRPLPEAEASAAGHLRGREVCLWVDLGRGEFEASFLTCDLSADYVRINAGHRS